MLHHFVTPVGDGRVSPQSIDIMGFWRMQKNVKAAHRRGGQSRQRVGAGRGNSAAPGETQALYGLMRQTIVRYRASDVDFVAAFDVDRRKVGPPLEQAIFAKPNNTRVLAARFSLGGDGRGQVAIS